MVKSVAQALPIYVMGVFKVSDGMCDSSMCLVMFFLVVGRWEK